MAIVLAYLLEWPTAHWRISVAPDAGATSIVLVLFVGILLLMAEFVVMPVAWQQDQPDPRYARHIRGRFSGFCRHAAASLSGADGRGIIDAMAKTCARIMTMGDSGEILLASLVGLLTLAVYPVLVR